MPDKKQIGGVNWELANDSAREWARRHSAQLVGGILDTTRDKIRRNVADFVENQRTFGELTANIQASGAFNQARANLIAVTETTGSYAEGNMVAWKESGVTEATMWNTNNDSLVCTICGPLDGVVVPLGSEFDGGGEGPPAHPGCRCWLTPRMLGDTETRADIDATYGLERMPGIGAPSVPSVGVPVRLQPAGVPVTENLGVIGDDARREFGDESLRAIDEVHGDGDLPRMRAYQQDNLEGDSYGLYKRKRNMDTDSDKFLEVIPDRILVSPSSTHQHMTMVHEAGHFIDDVGISGNIPGFASVESAIMDDWRNTVRQTDAYKEMQAALSGESRISRTIQRGGRSYTATPGDAFLTYVTDDTELFARSYAQYITERSSSTLLKSEMAAQLSSQTIPMQWAADDFAPVASAFDRLFQGLGWLR